jgi:protein-tyrosine phosphatase
VNSVSNWFRTYGFAGVLDGLLIGAYPLDREDVAMLEWMGIERVLNLVEDEEYRPGDRAVVEEALARTGIQEYRLRLTDYGRLPPEELETAVQEICSWLEQGVRGYLHCRAGWQRSAAVAAGVIAVREGVGIDDALEHVRSRKPSAEPLPHQREDLHRWWEARGGHRARAGDGAREGKGGQLAEGTGGRGADGGPAGAGGRAGAGGPAGAGGGAGAGGRVGDPTAAETDHVAGAERLDEA